MSFYIINTYFNLHKGNNIPFYVSHLTMSGLSGEILIFA